MAHEAGGRISSAHWTVRASNALFKPFSQVCRHARLCALVVTVACGTLAVPGIAQAAAPSVGIDVSGEIQAALAEANALVPPTAEVPVQTTVTVPTVPAVADGSITVSAPVEPVVTVSSSPASLTSPLASSAAAAPPENARAEDPSAQPQPAHALVQPARPSASQRREAALGARAAFARSAQRSMHAVTGSRSALTSRATRVTRDRDARPARQAPAEAVPQQPPPVPPSPRPDLTSSGQAGGQGSLLPLVMAALAAALAIFLFEVLRRVLPRSAFRKPKRLELRPWHPG